LYPVAYQFQVTLASVDEEDRDANWMMIRGDIGTADGRQWEFLCYRRPPSPG